MATISTAYKLLEHGENWEEIDGQWQATHTNLVFEDDGRKYRAEAQMTYRDYRHPGDIPLSAITKKAFISVESYAPEVKSWYTIAQPVHGEYHVKRPKLSHPNLTQFVAEIETLERLHSKDVIHPNIVAYHGCEIENGRVMGLCFEQCDQSLMQLCNPIGRSKRQVSNDWDPEEIAKCIDLIESAARHLHSLGLVHNDINPANIMFAAGRPVLIDFGSCCPVSEEVGGRTYEWYDESVTHATPKNDLDALQEIREWLSGKKDKVWLFKE